MEYAAKAIILVPLWANQAWFLMLLGILVNQPRIQSEIAEILNLPYNSEQHPLSKNIKKIACRVSGNPMRSKEYHQRQATFSWSHEDNPRRGIMYIYKVEQVCKSRHEAAIQISVMKIIEFLTQMFNSDISCSTIYMARSAISSAGIRFDNIEAEKDINQTVHKRN